MGSGTLGVTVGGVGSDGISSVGVSGVVSSGVSSIAGGNGVIELSILSEETGGNNTSSFLHAIRGRNSEQDNKRAIND